MRRRSGKRSLIALNAFLIGVLALVTLAPTPSDATTQPQRARGRYTMVAGEVEGLTAQGIYILDSVNRELIALSWNRSQDRLEPIGYRNLVADGRREQESR